MRVLGDQWSFQKKLKSNVVLALGAGRKGVAVGQSDLITRDAAGTESDHEYRKQTFSFHKHEENPAVATTPDGNGAEMGFWCA